MPDGVEQGRPEQRNDEGLGDFRARLQFQGPEDEHPDGADEELEGGEEPRVGEHVQGLLVVDIEDDVLEVPEPEDDAELEGLVRLRHRRFRLGSGAGAGLCLALRAGFGCRLGDERSGGQPIAERDESIERRGF